MVNYYNLFSGVLKLTNIWIHTVLLSLHLLVIYLFTDRIYTVGKTILYFCLMVSFESKDFFNHKEMIINLDHMGNVWGQYDIGHMGLSVFRGITTHLRDFLSFIKKLILFNQSYCNWKIRHRYVSC